MPAPALPATEPSRVVYPEARGFAAALSTYLARGGGRQNNPRSRKAGMRFTEGPIKGMTMEQAEAKVRQLWSTASPALREKYAQMDATIAAPSEMQLPVSRPSMPPSHGDPSRGGDTVQVQTPTAQPASTSSVPVSPVPVVTVNARTSTAGTKPLVTTTAPIASPPVDWENLGVAERQPAASPSPVRKPRFLDAPSRSQAITAGAVAGQRINKLTGKPFGWIPPEGRVDPAAQAVRRPYTGPRTSYVPGYGMVPKAEAVPEGPISYEDYDSIRTSLDSLDPRSPEASSARGRMRTFEEQARAREVAEMKAAREKSLRPRPVQLPVVRPTAADRYAGYTS